MANRRLVNWAIILGVGTFFTLLGYAAQPGGAATGYETGRQFGYALGQGIVAAVITYLVIRYVSRRSQAR